MKPPNEEQALQQVARRLAELLDFDPSEAEIRHQPAQVTVDAEIDLGGRSFVVEWKGAGAAAPVAMAAEQVREFAAQRGPRVVPLVAVPYMGRVGREQCEEAGVGWLDLSGNARISAPGIRVLVEGQPNRFKRRGRPSSAFAPKSARIARWLLLHPDRAMYQRDIAQATDMDEGFTSRIVSKLEEDELITRQQDGAISVRDPDLLLDAWREDYEFSKHRIVKGHAPARSGDALLGQLSERLGEWGIPYAATGLAAAWKMTRFAGFRIVTVYLSEGLGHTVLERLGIREEPQGSNVWLVVPNDQGVVHGAADQGGVRCVHPVQVYLDLFAHPERAREAADQLRAEYLNWRADG
jgi:hypothetical protein